MNKGKLKLFIADVLEHNDFDGCWYSNLGNDLYLVIAHNIDNDLDCKIAYNCDSLQCDYDFDWEIPYNKDGEMIGEEWIDLLECGYTANELANQVEAAYNYVIDCSLK